MLDSIGNGEGRILDNCSSVNNTVNLATGYSCLHNINSCSGFACINDISCGILVIRDIQFGIDKIKVCTCLKMEYCVSLDALCGRGNLYAVYNECLTCIYEEVTVANLNVILTKNNITVLDGNVVVIRVLNVNVKSLAVEVDNSIVDSSELSVDGNIICELNITTVCKCCYEFAICSNFDGNDGGDSAVCIGSQNSTVSKLNLKGTGSVGDSNVITLGNNDSALVANTGHIQFVNVNGDGAGGGIVISKSLLYTGVVETVGLSRTILKIAAPTAIIGGGSLKFLSCFGDNGTANDQIAIVVNINTVIEVVFAVTNSKFLLTIGCRAGGHKLPALESTTSKQTICILVTSTVDRSVKGTTGNFQKSLS